MGLITKTVDPKNINQESPNYLFGEDLIGYKYKKLLNFIDIEETSTKIEKVHIKLFSNRKYRINKIFKRFNTIYYTRHSINS